MTFALVPERRLQFVLYTLPQRVYVFADDRVYDAVMGAREHSLA